MADTFTLEVDEKGEIIIRLDKKGEMHRRITNEWKPVAGKPLQGPLIGADAPAGIAIFLQAPHWKHALNRPDHIMVACEMADLIRRRGTDAEERTERFAEQKS